MRTSVVSLVAISLSALVFGGCLLVRTTEMHIRLNKDGSGEALMRLIDIRSDGPADSVVNADFEELMKMLGDSTVGGFETSTRQVTAKQLLLQGDTLVGEVGYEFAGLGDLEGVRATDDELSVVVEPDRVVLGSNGRVEKRSEGGVRIVWDRDASRLEYQISERVVQASVSLAPMYKKRTR